MRPPSETGSILLLLAMITAMASLIALHLLLQSQLLYNQAQRFQIQVKDSIEAERCLQKLEEKRVKTEDFDHFIPDHLEFGCQTGIVVYENQVFPLHSTVVMPAP